MSESPRIRRLTKRAQFLLAAQGSGAARGAVLLQARPREDGDAAVGEGFTATKKIGGSVVRNRAKRRLREAARALLPLHGRPGVDYVFVARAGAPDRPWPRLLDDVKSALLSVAAGGDPPRSRGPRPARRPSKSPPASSLASGRPPPPSP